MLKFTITSDPIQQRPGYMPNGKYDEIFDQLTPEQNCIVLDDPAIVNRICGALTDYIKRRRISGGKAKGTIRYAEDGKPRVWLVYPTSPAVKTTIRGPFPGRK